MEMPCAPRLRLLRQWTNGTKLYTNWYALNNRTFPGATDHPEISTSVIHGMGPVPGVRPETVLYYIHMSAV
jgi:hypothetical protein